MNSRVIYDDFSSLSLANLKDFYQTIGLAELAPMVKGEGLKIAVLDTGIDFMHDYLANRVSGMFNVLLNSERNCRDRVGHGTFIAGLITGKEIGILRNASLYCIKITDDNGVLNHSTVIDGINWSINNQIDIICMAFGTAEYSIELEKAVKDANQKGITMIAAAGNNGEYIEYPAKFREVICVGSIDYALNRAEFSPDGQEIDIVLPAVNVPSLYSYNRFAISSGSSPATAIAVNIIGILQFLRMKYFNSKYSVTQLRHWFAKNTIDLGEIGFDNNYGFGVPDLTKVVHYLKETNFKPRKVF